MKLRRIALRSMPGIEPGFELDGLAAGLNVIVGPNGCGKTTLCRAVEATLWPERFARDAMDVQVWWEDDRGAEWFSHLRGGRVVWQCEAEEREPPEVPDEHLALCFFLGIPDLLDERSESELGLARRIRIRESGGYDLQGLLEQQQFRVSPQAGRSERRALQEAESRLAARHALLRELAEDEDRLQDLREQQERARQAYERAQVLESAIELARARQALEATRAALAALPAGLERFTGEERERLAELESDLAQARRARQACRDKLAAANSEIEASRLDPTRLDEAEAEAAEERARKLPELENELRKAEANLTEARARLEEALRLIGGRAGPESEGPRLDLSLVGELDALLQHRAELKVRLAAVEETLKTNVVHESPEDPLLLARGLDALRDWLAAPVPSRGYRVPLWMLGLACGCAGVGAVLALGSSPWWSILTGAGLGVLAVAFVVRALARGRGGGERELHLQRWWALHLEDPPAWTPEDVRELVDQLEKRLARAHLAAERRATAESAQRERASLEQRLRESERKREKLGRSLGIELPDSDLSLLEWAQRIALYREASGAQTTALAGHQRCMAAHQETLTSVDSYFGAWGYPASVDAAGAGAIARDFRARRERLRRGLERRSQAERECASHEVKIEQLEHRIEVLYRDRGMQAGDREGLQRCLAEWPTYKRLHAEEQRLLVRIAELEAKLDADAACRSLSLEQALEKRSQAEAEARRYQRTSEEIGEIEGRIEAARDSCELEVAASACEAAREDLRAARDRGLRAAASRWLIEDIEREHERRSRPEVLKRAMTWFQAFTRDRYELRLSSGSQPGFLAWDTSASRGLALTQLSDATRVQLFLAVRVAFAVQAERAERIPLFLDEALSTADPERFRAVTESLAVLAGEGRQVLYCTSNPADAAAFSALRAPSGRAPFEVKVLDLAAARRLASAVADPELLEAPPAVTIPSPEEKSAEQYGVELGVSMPDPYGPVEAMHLYYLLRSDLGLLHRVLSSTRVETVGQWRSLVASGRAESLLTRTIVRRIDTLCECAAAIFENWSIGRGKPVDREVLERSGAVKPTFIERFTELAADVGGDAERLMVTVRDGFDPRVKRFRSTDKDKLQAYLEEHGYIDGRRTLTPVEVEARVVRAMAEVVAAGRLTSGEISSRVRELLALFERSVGSARVAA